MRRDHDGYQVEDEDAPFAGGSTEQKDSFLADKLGETEVGSAAFREAAKVAQSHLDAPDAELVAFARPYRAGARSKDDFFRAATTARREQIGRQLYMSERSALWLTVNHLWAEPRSSEAA